MLYKSSFLTVGLVEMRFMIIPLNECGNSDVGLNRDSQEGVIKPAFVKNKAISLPNFYFRIGVIIGFANRIKNRELAIGFNAESI